MTFPWAEAWTKLFDWYKPSNTRMLMVKVLEWLHCSHKLFLLSLPKICYSILFLFDVVCPAGWKPGAETIIPDPEAKMQYFSKIKQEF